MATDQDKDQSEQLEQNSEAESTSNTGKIMWWTAAVVIGLLLIVVLRTLPLEQLMSGLKAWIESLGNWGPVALGALYIVATILCIPGTILSLAAGAVFGLWIGLVVVSIASTAGAACTFLIARHLGRERIVKLAESNRHLKAIDRVIGEGDWKVVGLLRLSPAIPFNIQNYLYGVTSVRFWPCILVSWIAMLPATFMYVYIGHVTGEAVVQERQRSTGEWIMLGIGLLATIVVSIYITRLAKRKLAEKDL